MDYFLFLIVFIFQQLIDWKNNHIFKYYIYEILNI